VSKLKEYRLERRVMSVEECYVEAESWEDAEEMGIDNDDWEFVYDETEIYSEEIENDKA